MTPIDDELLSAYIDGELTREERTVVSGLVQSEPHWKARLEAFQKDGESFRKLPARELSDRARVRAFQLAEANVDAGADRRRVPRYKRRWMLLAAMVIPTVLTLAFFQHPWYTSRLYLKSDDLHLEARRTVEPAEFEKVKQWQSPPLWGTYHPGDQTSLWVQLDSEEPEAQKVQLVVEYDFDGNGEIDRTEVYQPFELNLYKGWERFRPKTEQVQGDFRNFESGTVRLTLQADGVIKTSGTPGEMVLPYRDLRPQLEQ